MQALQSAFPCLRSGVHNQTGARDHGPGARQTKPNQTQPSKGPPPQPHTPQGPKGFFLGMGVVSGSEPECPPMPETFLDTCECQMGCVVCLRPIVSV